MITTAGYSAVYKHSCDLQKKANQIPLEIASVCVLPCFQLAFQKSSKGNISQFPSDPIPGQISMQVTWEVLEKSSCAYIQIIMQKPVQNGGKAALLSRPHTSC